MVCFWVFFGKKIPPTYKFMSLSTNLPSLYCLDMKAFFWGGGGLGRMVAEGW